MALRKRVWFNTPYHNYNDRRKYLLDTSEYNDYKLYEETNTAWNHGDFVNSSCVTSCPIDVFSKQPNYMIIMKDGVAESHWYVNGFQFISGEPTGTKSKFQVSLLRDVVVDFRSVIGKGYGKIHRGNLPVNVWSPILVQPEGLILNEVKVAQKDIQAWDKDTGWLTIFYDYNVDVEDRTLTFDEEGLIVGNYSKTSVQTDLSNNFNIVNPGGENEHFYYNRVWDELNWDFIIATTGGPLYGSATLRGDKLYLSNISWKMQRAGVTINTYNLVDRVVRLHKGDPLTTGNPEFGKVIYGNLEDELDDLYLIDKLENYNNAYNKYNNVIINTESGLEKVYLPSIIEASSATVVNDVQNKVEEIMRQLYWFLFFEFKSAFPRTYFNNPAPWLITKETYTYNYVNITANIANIIYEEYIRDSKMILPGAYKLDQMNLGCITIPFGINTSIKEDSNTYVLNEEAIYNLATVGITEAGSVIKDVQILPYCPSDVLNSLNMENDPNNIVDVSTSPSWVKVPITNSLNDTIYYGFICTSSSYSYKIPLDYDIGMNLKEESVTKKIRLRAHNHSSSFEFNPVLNGPNGVNSLKLQCTLRPFNTIYRIVPEFDSRGLYGGDYTDDRGLIWEGGFSLSQVTNAWTEYKLQNSTYKEVFSREIQNMEVNRENARALETLNYETAYSNARSNIRASAGKGIVSHLGGMAQAGLSAYMGDYGAAASQGISATTNVVNTAIGVKAASNIADRNLAAGKEAQGINDARHMENLSFKSDIFTLTNQAILAKPNNIASNSDYTVVNNNKAYFEVYDCTEEEKIYVTNLLNFRGMKIDQVGNITNYLINDMDYIEANLLFLPGLLPVISNQINTELTSGIYVQGGLFLNE